MEDENVQALVNELDGDSTTSNDAVDAPVEETTNQSSETADTQQQAQDEPDTQQQDDVAEYSEAATEPTEPTEPTYATKQDVYDALSQYSNDQSARVDNLNQIKQELISTYYPDGIDTTLRFSDGTEIKTAQDIVDMGVEKANGELFTYEEAAQWVMDQRQRISQNVEEIQGSAEQLATLNQDLLDGTERVRQLYGDILEADPQVAAEVTQAYLQTLNIDQERGVVIGAPIDIVEFYRLALAPYKQMNDEIAKRKELEAELEKRKGVISRDDRTGLRMSGQSREKSNTGDDMLDAFIDELGA